MLQQDVCPSVGLPEKSSNAVGGCPFQPYLGLVWTLFWPYFRNLQMPLGVALIWALFGPYLRLILPYFKNIQMLLGVALISALFGPYLDLILALFWPYFGLISILLFEPYVGSIAKVEIRWPCGLLSV